MSAKDPETPERGLRSNSAFRRLWISRTVSSFGDSLGLVGLTLFVADSVGAAFAVAALLLVGDFAPSLLGPVAGTLADRFDRRKVLLASELIQAVAVFLIALTLPPLPVLLGLVAVRAVAFQVLQPASRSAVPTLVADQHLERANSAWGSARAARRRSARWPRPRCCRSSGSVGCCWSMLQRFCCPLLCWSVCGRFRSRQLPGFGRGCSHRHVLDCSSWCGRPGSGRWHWVSSASSPPTALTMSPSSSLRRIRWRPASRRSHFFTPQWVSVCCWDTCCSLAARPSGQ